MDHSIAETVMLCKQSFQSLVSALGIIGALDKDGGDEARIDPQQLQDEFDRFKIWFRNIGAHRDGRSSLDYQLRDTSKLRNQVLNLLGDLNEYLNDASSIIFGRKVPWDQQSPADDILEDTSDDTDANEDESGLATDSELGQISEDITEIVGCLLRLSTSIKNSVPIDQFKLSSETGISYLEVLYTQHVRTKFPAAPEQAVASLGRANSQRRQYFRCRKADYEEFATELEPESEKTAAVGPSTAASSIPLHFRSDTLPYGLNVLDEDQQSDTVLSQKIYTTSIGDSERLRVPLIPRAYETGPFECPFCFTMISVASNDAWKEHVFSDLRPYICLSEHCQSSNQLYSGYQKWSEHYLQRHWRVWTCPFGCNGEDMDSARDMQSHLIQSHPEVALSNDIHAIADMSERSKSLNASSNCPLCEKLCISAREYLEHVGWHQEQLALFALPELASQNEEGNYGREHHGSVQILETGHLSPSSDDQDSKDAGNDKASSSKQVESATQNERLQPVTAPLSQIEKSVTQLLVATKQLLETLTLWSRRQATDTQVSDVFVRLGYEYNMACRAFTSIDIDTSDLGDVPGLLRSILEETLSQEATVETLEKYLPRIKDIIVDLLHGLKRKQQKIRQSRAK